MATVTTSHYKIFDYWRDKIIDADGHIVKSARDLQSGYEVVVEDADVPRCWGCGIQVVRDSKFDEWAKKQFIDDDYESNLKRMWDSKEVRSKFNRCHIVPGALGGEDTPSNLFLMCENCHVLSPDTKYPSMFFKWVLERRKKMIWGTWHPEYLFEKVDELLKRDYRITLMDLLSRINDLGGKEKIKDLSEFMHDRIGLHGSKLSESSAIIAVEQWLVSIYTDLLLE